MTCPAVRTWLAATAPCALVPEEVETDPWHFGNRDVVAIGAGGYQSCAVVQNGRVFCWGEQSDGTGFATISTFPAGRGVAGRIYRGVAVGGNHACAILDTGGAHCWGRNNTGQLGRGTLTRIEYGADLVLSPPAAYRSLGLGLRHSCGIRDDSQGLHCWGVGESFEPMRRDQPQPVLVTNF